jgi:hypothetical protein
MADVEIRLRDSAATALTVLSDAMRPRLNFTLLDNHASALGANIHALPYSSCWQAI